jgi:hypothetical protein
VSELVDPATFALPEKAKEPNKVPVTRILSFPVVATF